MRGNNFSPDEGSKRLDFKKHKTEFFLMVVMVLIALIFGSASSSTMIISSLDDGDDGDIVRYNDTSEDWEAEFFPVYAEDTVDGTELVVRSDHGLVDEVYEDWAYFRKITIDHSFVDADLANFPVLINSTNTDLIGKCQGNGEDIRFVNLANDTEFYYEIERWTEGGFDIWVNITSISSSVDTVFLMYYNNSGASDDQSAADVWDSNYLAVYHMNDNTSSDVSDSTINSFDSIKNATDHPIQINGKIGYGQSFDGVNDVLNSSNPGLDPENLTLEAWSYETVGGSTYPRIISKETATVANPYAMETHSGVRKVGVYVGDGIGEGYAITPTDSISFASWYYFAGTFNNATNQLLMYINGSLAASAATAHFIKDNGTYFLIGNNPLKNRQYEGILDEIRVSNIARNNSWFNCSYDNQNNIDGFMSFSNEHTHALTSFDHDYTMVFDDKTDTMVCDFIIDALGFVGAGAGGSGGSNWTRSGTTLYTLVDGDDVQVNGSLNVGGNINANSSDVYGHVGEFDEIIVEPVHSAVDTKIYFNDGDGNTDYVWTKPVNDNFGVYNFIRSKYVWLYDNAAEKVTYYTDVDVTENVTVTNDFTAAYLYGDGSGLTNLPGGSGGSNWTRSGTTLYTLYDGDDVQVNGTITATGGNSGQWNTAYGWGDHSGEGYLTAETDPVWSASDAFPIQSGWMDTWNASGEGFWNDDGSTLFTKDSGRNVDVNGTITATGGNSGQWNTAFGWGDHAGIYALLNHWHNNSYFLISILQQWMPNWNTSFGWGDHSAQNYLDLDTYPNTDTDNTDDLNKTDSFSGEVTGTYDVTVVDNDALDDQYIELGDSFGGDVTGTYDATVIADNSHWHNNSYFLISILQQWMPNWNTSFDWGDHSGEGYLTTETDPVWSASDAFPIQSGWMDTWNTSYWKLNETDENTVVLDNSDYNVSIGKDGVSDSKLLVYSNCETEVRVETTCNTSASTVLFVNDNETGLIRLIGYQFSLGGLVGDMFFTNNMNDFVFWNGNVGIKEMNQASGFELDVNGDIQCTSITETSDSRVKDVIYELKNLNNEYVLRLCRNINIVLYKFNETLFNVSNDGYGCSPIAQVLHDNILNNFSDNQNLNQKLADSLVNVGNETQLWSLKNSNILWLYARAWQINDERLTDIENYLGL